MEPAAECDREFSAYQQFVNDAMGNEDVDDGYSSLNSMSLEDEHHMPCNSSKHTAEEFRAVHDMVSHTGSEKDTDDITQIDAGSFKSVHSRHSNYDERMNRYLTNSSSFYTQSGHSQCISTEDSGDDDADKLTCTDEEVPAFDEPVVDVKMKTMTACLHPKVIHVRENAPGTHTRENAPGTTDDMLIQIDKVKRLLRK